MFAWHAYARPIAVKLWEEFVAEADFEFWTRHWEVAGSEAPMDFLIEDKRARFLLRGTLPPDTTIAQLGRFAEVATKAAGMDVDFLRFDNSDPVKRIYTMTFELARVRANASGFKERAQ